MPCGVQQHQQRVALAAGEGQVRVARQPDGRRRRPSGSPFSSASGTGRQHLADQVVAQRRPAARPRRPARRRPRSRRPRRGRRSPAASSVPERTSRSWPPPCSSGVSATLAAEQQRAGAERAAELVPGERQRVDAATRRSRPAGCPTACTASVCNGTPCSWATAASSRDRVDGADLVVGPHHRRPARPLGAVGERRRAASRGAPGPRRRPAAGRPRAPSCSASHSTRVQHGVVLDRRDQHAARGAGRRAPARQYSALDGEVVALGAAGGEARPRTAGADRARRCVSRDSSTTPPGPPAGGVQRRRVAGPAAARRSSPSTASGSIGVVAAWSRYRRTRQVYVRNREGYARCPHPPAAPGDRPRVRVGGRLAMIAMSCTSYHSPSWRTASRRTPSSTNPTLV